MTWEESDIVQARIRAEGVNLMEIWSFASGTETLVISWQGEERLIATVEDYATLFAPAPRQLSLFEGVP